MKRLPLIALMLLLLAWPGRTQLKQHAVTLYWNAAVPASGDPNAIASYNIKRGTVSGGPYSLLGNVPASATQVQCVAPLTGTCFTFADSSGTGGTTYDYVVTTVDAGGFESANSPQASATAVANPNPPGAPVAVSN